MFALVDNEVRVGTSIGRGLADGDGGGGAFNAHVAGFSIAISCDIDIIALTSSLLSYRCCSRLFSIDFALL